MPRISGSPRSPTPVPASTSTSASTRKDVVRQSLAIAPEQPSTRIFMPASDAPPLSGRSPLEGRRTYERGGAMHGLIWFRKKDHAAPIGGRLAASASRLHALNAIG